MINKDITLKNIYETLWKKKIFLILSILVSGILIYYVSFLVKPEFEARVTLTQPIQTTFSKLNTWHKTFLPALSALDQFNFFKAFLTSKENQTQVLKNFKIPLSFTYVVLPLNTITVSVKGKDNHVVSQALHDLLSNSQVKTIKNLNKGLKQELVVFEEFLNNSKNYLQSSVSSSNKLRKQVLEEAYKIAEAINLKIPVSASSTSLVSANINYLRGTQALKEELKTLNNSNRVNPESLTRIAQIEYEYNLARAALPIINLKVYQKISNIEVIEVYSRRKNFFIYSFLLCVCFLFSVTLFMGMHSLSVTTNKSYD